MLQMEATGINQPTPPKKLVLRTLCGMSDPKTLLEPVAVHDKHCK
jgi:hypothetical protein